MSPVYTRNHLEFTSSANSIALLLPKEARMHYCTHVTAPAAVPAKMLQTDSTPAHVVVAALAAARPPGEAYTATRLERVTDARWRERNTPHNLAYEREEQRGNAGLEYLQTSPHTFEVAGH